MSSKLKEVMDTLNKKFGVNAVSVASDMPAVRRVKSSLPMYNYVTDGGFAVNRFHEHLGPQSSTKSWCAYDAIAQFQKYDWANAEENAFASVRYKNIKGSVFKEVEKTILRRGYKPKVEPKVKFCVLIDIEKTYTKEWGSHLGINNDGLILIQPARLTEAVDIAQALLAMPEISLLVIDSLSAVGTDGEIDSSMEEHRMAENARFWNKAIRKLQSALNTNPEPDATVIVMNSSYEKVGVVMGDPEVVRNGKQLGLTKSISIKFRAQAPIMASFEGKGKIAVGKNIIIKNLKNKVGAQFREGSYYYAIETFEGVEKGTTDIVAQLIDLGVRYEVIKRAGAFYSFDGLKGQGVDKFKAALNEAGKLKDLESALYKAIEEDK